MPNPWKPIKTYRGDQFRKVDVWMTVHASPMSFGIGDAFRVPECWRRDGKWFHCDHSQERELSSHYITHWMPMPRPPAKR